MAQISCAEVSCSQKQSSGGVLKYFVKFTGKHLYQGLFFDKVAGFKPATLLKKSLWYWCFPLNFAEYLKAHI